MATMVSSKFISQQANQGQSYCSETEAFAGERSRHLYLRFAFSQLN
jgi:hypothetical protein